MSLQLGSRARERLAQIPDLTGGAGGSPEQMAVQDEAGADAGAQRDEEHVSRAPGAPLTVLSERSEVRLVVHQHGTLEARQPLVEVHVAPPRNVDREGDLMGVRVNDAGHRDRHGEHGTRDRRAGGVECRDDRVAETLRIRPGWSARRVVGEDVTSGVRGGNTQVDAADVESEDAAYGGSEIENLRRAPARGHDGSALDD
jgi:hypothetical protein